ncbi:MAG TPA: DUF481 domain-containing protein [Acidobacteriaceae bacterium]|nr:DUF481 domain-containing protein [Acidobacteriaceae bacterium]
MLRTTASVVLCFFVAGAAAFAQNSTPDILVFTNGDQLTGHVERVAGGSVVFKSDMAGELTIPLDKVKDLRSGSAFAVIKKGPPARSNLVGEGDVHVAEGNVTVTPSNQAAATIPAKDLGYIVDAPTYDKQVAHEFPFREGWTGAIVGGATIVRATDNTTSLTAGIALSRTVPSVAYLPLRNRTTFDLIETYGKSTSPVIPRNPIIPDSVTKTSIFHTDAERDEYFNPRMYGLVDVAFDHNYAQGLTLQQIYGIGIGWTAIQTAHQQLDMKADIHYEKQKFQTGPSTDLIGTIFGETYHRDLAYKLAFNENGNFIPSWNHPSDYSAMVTGALVIPTYKRLSTSISVTDNYLNNPSPGYNKNSFQFVAGISYALK